MPERRYNIKSILINTVWILLGAGTIVLLVAAINKKDSNRCKDVEIIIKGVQNNFFIDKSDVTNMLEKMNLGTLKGTPIAAFNLAEMETFLKKNEWIKNAELYFDNNDELRINIMEREPIARVFNSEGGSFYIDSLLTVLPLSDKFSARLPVFTNFSLERNSRAGKNLLAEIKKVSVYISQSPFWMAQIEQVDITPEGSFEMIPKIGNQVIIFGSAENYEEKFSNLFIFYESVQSKIGWSKYSVLNVSYKDQVIAVKRDAKEIKMDSLKAIQMMKLLVANAQKQANDSINNIQLVQPKDDNSVPFAQPQDDKTFGAESLPDLSDTAAKNVSVAPSPATSKSSLPVNTSSGAKTILTAQPPGNKSHSNEKPNPIFIKRAQANPTIKKPADVINKQPKAIMNPKNDY
jgi:cell division protein FtsQ